MLAESIERWNREIREEGFREGLEQARAQLREEGRQQGIQEGEATMVLRLLRSKFGPVAPEVEERVLSMDADQLLERCGRLLTAERLQDFFGD